MTAASDRRALFGWVIALVLLAMPRAASAQPSSAGAGATAQFDKGRALMKEKKYADACTAFERSQKLEPQPGTLYNLALCYVEIGKLATAWASFRELAVKDPNPARRKASDKQASTLAKRMPKLVLRAPNAPTGLVVKMNGVDVSGVVGTDTPVDLGTHAIEATAPRFNRFTTTAKITQESKTVTVELALVPIGDSRPVDRVPVKPPVEPSRLPDPIQPVAGRQTDTPATPRSTRRRNAAIVGVTGGALLVTGVVFGRLAAAKWDEAKDFCGDDLMCNNATELEAGNQLVSDARLRANISTGLVIGGVVTMGIASYLWLTAPRADARSPRALRITPSVEQERIGLVVDGRF